MSKDYLRMEAGTLHNKRPIGNWGDFVKAPGESAKKGSHAGSIIFVGKYSTGISRSDEG